MTSHCFSAPSIIEKVTFKTSDNGSKRAYLCAAEDAPLAEIKKIVTAMSNEGWYIIHSICDGKPALEVRGYLLEKSVTQALAHEGFTLGPGTIDKEKEQQSSFVDKLRGRTLQGTSAFFLAADASFSRYGYKEGHPEDVAAGIAYGMGSATMGLIGTNAQAMDEIRKQVKKLLKYTGDQGIDTSKSFTIPIVTENNKRDVFHKIIDTLQTYPTEIGNSFTSLAGALIAYGAYKYKVKPEKPSAGHSRFAGYMDVGLGMSTIMSGTIGAWMKEKKHDPDVPYKEGLEGWKEWILERPLSVAAFGYMFSTVCHTVSTIVEHNKAKKVGDKKILDAVKWRAGFIGCTIIGEILMMMSSKGHGEGVKSDPSTEESVIAIAAEIIAQQKAALQPELIDKIGHFLGRQDVLGGKDGNMIERLTKQVEIMRHNPWLKAMDEVRQEKAPQAAPAATVGGLPVTKVAKGQQVPAWQQKLAATPPVAPHLSV